MGYSKLFEILESERLKAFITNLSSDKFESPFIYKETLKVLDDESIYFNLINDANKKALVNMMDFYFKGCWDIFIDNKPMEKLLQYGKIEVYSVTTYKGKRYATVKEVAQGVKGLSGEFIYPAGEEEYKLLCLLYWTFTGKNYFFRQAGYKLDYNKDGEMITPFYSMVVMCANQLKDLFDFVKRDKDYNQAIKKLERMKKSKGYRYASYEDDDIQEDITIKQLLYNIYTVFPRNSNNEEYRKALALAIKGHKDKKKLSPLEISTLRGIYDKFALDRDRMSTEQIETNEALKNVCEFILRERYNGKIDPKHFAYTIIDTLKKKNYTKCSEKQYRFIEDALKILKRDTDDNGDVPELPKLTTSGATGTARTPVLSDYDIEEDLSSSSYDEDDYYDDDARDWDY